MLISEKQIFKLFNAINNLAVAEPYSYITKGYQQHLKELVQEIMDQQSDKK